MFLATQYYRPPFPNRRFWSDDFARIRDSGLHAVQLWCIWGWVEAEPGAYDYDDYDELIALAEKRGLKVVLSTIAEIHPFWIHRVVPGSEMIDHMGRTVVSSCRGEVNVGLTPGGCTDHPRIAELVRRFLTDIASRYARAANLIGWDCWNETRWCVQADGFVCHCPHTLAKFRSHLDRRHGGLRGLNAAWQRRYVSWDDVRPGKLPGRPYTEMVEFLRFQAARAAEHARFRYDAIRAGDPKHFISAHCGTPAIQNPGGGSEPALARGVDSDLADQLDGFGCSHFPAWFDISEADFGVRVEAVRSANRGKTMWISELQGGSSRGGFSADRAVMPDEQQRWVAGGMARGAKGVIFWCWRDEVFTHEASGFGLAGWDGQAAQRLAAMKTAGAFIDAHRRLIDAYRPDRPQVGVLFVPDNYMIEYAHCGLARQASQAVNAYARALDRLRIPYEIVEARHLDVLDDLRVLLMPWCLVLPDPTRGAVLKFCRRGGRVLCEAETDAYDEQGFYRYPDERPLMKALRLHDLGRRKLGADAVLIAELDGEAVELVLDNFTTPLRVGGKTQVLARSRDDEVLLARQAVGQGAAYVLGGFLGPPYLAERNEGLERLIEHVFADAGCRRAFDVRAGDRSEELTWRTGPAGRNRLLWIVNSGGDAEVTITDQAGHLAGRRSALELRAGRAVPIRRAGGAARCRIRIPAGAWAVIKC